jgi:hypothetical protein
MKRRENASRRSEERATAGYGRNASRARDTGLAVEGPGFLVWDEIATDARKNAAELWAVARWRIRSAAQRS